MKNCQGLQLGLTGKAWDLFALPLKKQAVFIVVWGRVLYRKSLVFAGKGFI
jgi:hypothetical protein